MPTPDELQQYRAAALQELTLGLARLSSAELDMTRSMQVAGMVEAYKGRLAKIEELESTANYERTADAARAAAYREQVYGVPRPSTATPARGAGGQFTSNEEANIQALQREMEARGLGRL